MSVQKTRSPLYDLLFIVLAFVILGALTLSVASILENLRIARASAQFSRFVETVRVYAVAHPTYVFVPGKDVWALMVQDGRISASAAASNPWDGRVSAYAVSPTQIRVETDLPSQSCRRLALLMLEENYTNLLSIEAHPDPNTEWAFIFPAPAVGIEKGVAKACGFRHRSQMAMIYKIK